MGLYTWIHNVTYIHSIITYTHTYTPAYIHTYTHEYLHELAIRITFKWLTYVNTYIHSIITYTHTYTPAYIHTHTHGTSTFKWLIYVNQYIHTHLVVKMTLPMISTNVFTALFPAHVRMRPPTGTCPVASACLQRFMCESICIQIHTHQHTCIYMHAHTHMYCVWSKWALA